MNTCIHSLRFRGQYTRRVEGQWEKKQEHGKNIGFYDGCLWIPCRGIYGIHVLQYGCFGVHCRMAI